MRFLASAISFPAREVEFPIAEVGSPISRIARCWCSCGTLVAGDISIHIDDGFLACPRIVRRKVSSMRPMSIPRRSLFLS
jgi:hypothetical protein